MKTKLFLTALVIWAATMTTSAQAPAGKTGNGAGNGTCKGSAYVDTNKNGICDNYEKRNASGEARQGGGNGKCKGTGGGKCKGQGKGRNFVDSNKNGVCDNYEVRHKK